MKKSSKATDQSAEIRRVTWAGLIANLVLAGVKFAAGYFGRSQTLLADAVHSLSDSTTDIAVIVGSYYWSRPPDECHPYGHRRIETLVTIFVGFVLLAAGVGIVWHAISTLQERGDAPPGLIALAAAIISILCKEWLYRWTAAVGKKIRSSALTANAWHHRSDALSSIPAVFAVGGAWLFPSWSFLDQVGAVIVSIFIFQAAFRIIWPGTKELIDAGAPAEIRARISHVARSIEGVMDVHGIRTRYVSTSLQVDLHVLVDGAISVREGHDIADLVRDEILSRDLDVVDVVVHIEPDDGT
ncbi:MAG: cation transporter [Desulfobulbaceae bacterium]|nr:cation transporter [Desulfobulbaceae bacterium]